MSKLTNFKQENFVIYELVLPYCTVCTPANGFGSNQWHTPVTCEESSDAEYSLFFTSQKAPSPLQQPHPSMPGVISKLNSRVEHTVTSASSSTAMLKPGEGLASRSTISLTMEDFDGDPGPINFTDNGTFFGKLRARNILIGKKIISHYYSRVNQNGEIFNVTTETHFIESTDLSNGKFKVTAKDALKDIEAFSDKFPLPSDIELAEDIDSSVTSFEITDATGLVNGDVIRIESELLRLNADPVGNVISTYTRGQGFSVDSQIIYKTTIDSHSEGATVQPCYAMWGYRIYDVLLELFDSAGLSDYTNYDQWKEEIDSWNSDAKLYGVMHESKSYEKRINSVLSKYMVDMWLDQPTQKLVTSTTNAWKLASRQLVEGDDFSDLSTKDLPTSRYSRAMVYNYKEYKTENDDPVNYAKLIVRADTEKEGPDFYGDIKLKEFDPSDFMTNSDAISLCQRYIQRFSTVPKQLTFTMEERKLATTTIGDVVEVISRDKQTAEGLLLTSKDRVQVTRIQPDLNKIGRQYKVTGLSYVPLLTVDEGGELYVFRSGELADIDLYTEAGKPNQAINVTFVFDAATIGSTSPSFYSMDASGFIAGSRIRIILTNGTIWSAIGGDGGDAYAYAYADSNASKRREITTTTSATNGGDGYNSSGIETEIYVNYTEISGYTPTATIAAAGGGGASASAASSGYGRASAASAVAGGGGSGLPAGTSGTASASALTDAGNQDSGFCIGDDGGLYVGGSGCSANAFSSTTYDYTSSDDEQETETQTATAEAESSDGGSSLNAELSTSYSLSTLETTEGDSSSKPGTVSTGAAGQAGYAFVGGNITVYNTDSSKLRDGRNNGSGYTLIES